MATGTMASSDCAICDHARILTKCSHCGRRVCYNCYVTRNAMCVPCAKRQGVRQPVGIFRAMS